MNIEIALCLPREARTVALVRSVALTTFERFGVSADCIDDIRLAISEACTNVIEHSESSDEYEVRLAVDGKRCTISVIDAGRRFDHADLSGSMPATDSPGGRGLALMKALTDRVDFELEPEAGTVVRLVKTLELDPGSPLASLH